jgi:hypothetical protein
MRTNKEWRYHSGALDFSVNPRPHNHLLIV